jgi:hypothetical protein
LYVATPGAAAIASAVDRDWTWRFWLPTAIALLAASAVTVTLIERQWTSISEMALLRPAMVLFLLWLGLISYRLRRMAVAPFSNHSVVGGALDAEPRGLA